MTKNVGGVEQKIRWILGVLAIGVAALAELPMWAAVGLGLAGVIALVTGSVKYCPVWTLLGVNTCPLKNQSTR